ncbi:MAG: glycosyltransferase, partial [Synergistaceae bacterium]|nr:glycosyltransferase [Synergistaceae bacterium]
MKDNIIETGNRVCFTPFRSQNAYISLMRKAINLTNYGLFKDESRVYSLFKCNIFHFNWDIQMSLSKPNTIRRKIKYLTWFLMIYAIRLKGGKIIFTLHNKMNHDRNRRYNELEKITMLILKYAYRVVIHSTESISVVRKLIPDTDTRRIVYVPHPNYITAYHNLKPYTNYSRKENEIVLLFMGLMRPYKNIEIIIVNDGSEEDEDSIIREYLTHDKRIRYIRKEENEGLFKARVTGVKEANGEFIQFVDSDDYINQDFIRLLVEKADDDNSDMVFAKTVTCTPNGSETIFVFQNSELYKLPLEKAELQKAFWEQHGCAYLWHTIWNKLYRKTIWDKAIPYFEILNERHVMTEDIAFSSVLYFYADKASFAPNATYFYCKHS